MKRLAFILILAIPIFGTDIAPQTITMDASLCCVIKAPELKELEDLNDTKWELCQSGGSFKTESKLTEIQGPSGYVEQWHLTPTKTGEQSFTLTLKKSDGTPKKKIIYNITVKC